MTETKVGWPQLDSPEALTELLIKCDYLPDEALAAAAYLALQLQRPLFLEGAPGVGKTDFSRRIATALGANWFRLQCYAGMDATQALYDWNFPKQILAMRAAQADGSSQLPLDELYHPRFLLNRPVLRAIEEGPAVLLIDEIDRADDEFEALLLEVLEDYTITIPELGEPIRATIPPLVILTSNRTREVHEALKRRCLYHWISHPSPHEEQRILELRVRGIREDLAAQIAAGMKQLREEKDIIRPPGVAECIDFAMALTARGFGAITPVSVKATISTLVKHHDPHSRVPSVLLRLPRPRDGQ